MNAVFAVQLLILVWTFTAVCQDEEDVCDDVTGSVGKEVTLSCSISLQNTGCCIINYKFQYPKIFNDSSICRQDVSVNSCEQRNSFKCRYTPTTVMTEQFRFFVQTTCGMKRTKFTLDSSVSSRRLDPVNPSGSPPPGSAPRFKGTVITVVVAGFIIILISS